jgi:hypothetical protein
MLPPIAPKRSVCDTLVCLSVANATRPAWRLPPVMKQSLYGTLTAVCTGPSASATRSKR